MKRVRRTAGSLKSGYADAAGGATNVSIDDAEANADTDTIADAAAEDDAVVGADSAADVEAIYAVVAVVVVAREVVKDVGNCSSIELRVRETGLLMLLILLRKM